MGKCKISPQDFGNNWESLDQCEPKQEAVWSGLGCWAKSNFAQPGLIQNSSTNKYFVLQFSIIIVEEKERSFSAIFSAMKKSPCECTHCVGYLSHGTQPVDEITKIEGLLEGMDPGNTFMNSPKFYNNQL